MSFVGTPTAYLHRQERSEGSCAHIRANIYMPEQILSVDLGPINARAAEDSESPYMLVSSCCCCCCAKTGLQWHIDLTLDSNYNPYII